ncbi:MAG TPA: arsenic resistance N-acetyltransferase ArsN2 [Burkholderiales bacterium]
MNIVQYPAAAAVKRLLEEANLPTSDLTEAHLENFLGCGANGSLDGVVGLELYPPVALLRSLAVASSRRGRGVGSTLLAEAERYARLREVKEIYLLTTTAEQFFARSGYEHIVREAAPPAIRETQEFSSLCPASSAVMRKRL